MASNLGLVERPEESAAPGWIVNEVKGKDPDNFLGYFPGAFEKNIGREPHPGAGLAG